MNNSAFLSIAELDKEDGSFHGHDFHGHKGFDRDEMKKLFERSGFKNVRVDTCYEIKRITEQNQNVFYPVF